LFKDIVILFPTAHHPISQVTQLLEQFPWKYLALHHRPCIWRPPTWAMQNSEEKHFWGNDKLKANVPVDENTGSRVLNGRHTAHSGQTPQLLW